MLGFAAEYGHVGVMEELLVWNANPNQYNNDGRTPLFFAVREGHTAMVELLLINDANPNALATGHADDGEEDRVWGGERSEEGGGEGGGRGGGGEGAALGVEGRGSNPVNAQTPLLQAASSGILQVVQLLLAYGADPIEGTTKAIGANDVLVGADAADAGSGGAGSMYPTALATVWPWLFAVSEQDGAEEWLQLLLVTVENSPGRLGLWYVVALSLEADILISMRYAG
jgi:ankyrin repeat protein